MATKMAFEGEIYYGAKGRIKRVKPIRVKPIIEFTMVENASQEVSRFFCLPPVKWEIRGVRQD